MTTKYTTEEVKQLYSIAVDQGWDALESNEKIAVGRYCRKHGINRPGLEPPDGAIATARTGHRDAGTTTSRGNAKHANPDRDRRRTDHRRTVFQASRTGPGGVRGNGDQQARNTPNRRRHRIRHRSGTAAQRPVHRTLARRHRDHPCATASKWKRIAQALRRFPDRPAIVAEGKSRRRALELRRRLRNAKFVGFQPKGSYRVEIAPDRRHKDCYVVIAQYRGAEQ